MSRKKNVHFPMKVWQALNSKHNPMAKVDTAAVQPLQPRRSLAQLMTPDVYAQFIGVSLGELPEGQHSKPTQFYFFSDGLWCAYTLPMGRMLVRKSKWTDPQFPVKPKEWKQGFELTLPRIPADLFLQVVAFFKAVSAKYNSEVYVSIFWDGVTYHVEVPDQVVSHARVEHQQQRDVSGEIEVLQLHSHNTMPAFFSGQDTADELEHGQRVYAVMGKITQTIPESKWRLQAGGIFHDIALLDMVAWPDFYVEQHVNGAALFPMGGSLTGETLQPMAWDPCEGVTFPEAWLEGLSTVITPSLYPEPAVWNGHQNWHDLAIAHLQKDCEPAEPLLVEGGMLMRASQYNCLGKTQMVECTTLTESWAYTPLWPIRWHEGCTQIILAGCGGTGARVLGPLMKILPQSALVSLFDADIVEARNIGRQHFMLEDIGYKKAEVLADRFMPDDRLEAIPKMLDQSQLEQYLQSSSTQTIVLGCTDSPHFRAMMARIGIDRLLWIDAGNERHTGQVAIEGLYPGFVTNKLAPEQAVPLSKELADDGYTADDIGHAAWRGVRGPFSQEMIPPTLHFTGVSRYFPELIAEQPEDDTPHCEERLDLQTVGVNQLAATWVVCMLANLLSGRQSSIVGVQFSTDGISTPLKIQTPCANYYRHGDSRCGTGYWRAIVTTL